MKIPLTQGRVALVDDEDYPALSQYKWHFHNGYAARSTYIDRIPGRVFMHNQLLNASWVDHADRNGLNNCRKNLRVASRSLQGHNRLMPTRDLPRGVAFHKGRYQASIRVNGVLQYLGRYDTPEKASTAYREQAKLIHGEYPPE